MKKFLLVAALSGCLFSANAQNVIEQPTFFDNWQIGLDAGVQTPLKGHSFIQNMRGNYGVHIAKQLTPVVGVGVESQAGVNTSWSKTAFDNLYVGAYGTADLFNLLGGYQCAPRVFSIDAVTGIGWLRDLYAGHPDRNAIAAKAGLNFKFNVSDNFSIAIKPDVLWRIAESDLPTQFDARRARFDCMVGFNYNFGPGFQCVAVPDNSAEFAALNAQINALRADVATAATALAASTADNAALAAALAECQAQPAQVVNDTTNTLTSVRYVFFKLGSSVITPDQMPNVEMIASYLKNHPDAKVEVKGYASADGNQDFNIKLAQNRAESVKKALVAKYKIDPARIIAKGEGIGHMFSEESWNRVSICTLQD